MINISKDIKPGFAAVKIFLIIAILAGLGAGGYFYVYPTYFAPLTNSVVTLVPESLQQYDLGKNADGFLVYKKDQDLEELIDLNPAAADSVKMLNAAVGYYSSKEESLVFIMEFVSNEAASSAVSSIEAQKAIFESGAINLNSNFKVEQNENVVIISLGKGLAAFEGPLAENPDMSLVDKDLHDSQLIVSLNHKNTPEITLLMFALANTLAGAGMGFSQAMVLHAASPVAMIPQAHAQSGFLSPTDNPGRIAEATGGEASTTSSVLTVVNGMLSVARNTVIIGRYKEQKLNVQTHIYVVGKDELSESAVVKLGQEMSGTTIDADQLAETYDKYTTSLKEAIPPLQKQIKEAVDKVKLVMPETDMSMDYDGEVLKIAFNSSLNDIKYAAMPLVLGAPQSARNAARKADVNNIVASAEQYNAANGDYPENSGCLETLSELDVYFKRAPQDSAGTQQIGGQECSSGYYYQRILGRGYIVWSKIEGDSGNTGETPETIVSKIDSPDFYDNLSSTKTGAYYIYADIRPAKGGSSLGGGIESPVVPKKVKRAVN